MNHAVSDTAPFDQHEEHISIKPIRDCIPHIEETLASRLNILHERGIYAKTQVQQTSAHWRLEYACQLNKSWIKLAHDNTEIWIALDQFHWCSTVNDRHWQSFDEMHLPLAFSIAHTAFLTHLQSLTGNPWRVVDANQNVEQAPENFSPYVFSVEHNQQISTGAIAFSVQALTRLTSRNIWHRAALPRHEAISRLPIAASVEIAVLPLSLAELRQFEPGDLLICGNYQALSKQIYLTSSHSRRPLWRLQKEQDDYIVTGSLNTRKVDSDNLTAISELTPENKHMEDPIMQKDNVNSTEAINDLPVDLSIEIGNLNMTVGELDNIEPGHVLKIPPENPNKQARLIANGLAIGRGEIVMIGDQLAIRLTELAK